MPDAASSSDPAALAEALSRAAVAIAQGADLDATLQEILAAATEAVGASGASLLLQDPDRPEPELAATVGIPAPPATGATDPAVEAIRDRNATFRPGEVALPLLIARESIEDVVGAVTFRLAPGREVAPAERTFLSAIAALAAVAIDRSRLASLIAERSEWFERMAHSDPLTGLANQRTFARVLELELARAARQGGEVSVAVFDIDGFMATNERAGHEAGDDVLRAVAVVLNESVRLVDTVARLGGDEFVLVAPGAAGTTVAQRVLAGVAKLEPVGDRPVSVSAGVVRFPTDGTTADELLQAAIEALDAAKGRGPGTLEASASQPTG